jgi:hypothetical protein
MTQRLQNTPALASKTKVRINAFLILLVATHSFNPPHAQTQAQTTAASANTTDSPTTASRPQSGEPTQPPPDDAAPLPSKVTDPIAIGFTNKLFSLAAQYMSSLALGGLVASLGFLAFKQREPYLGDWTIVIYWNEEGQKRLVGIDEPTLISEGNLTLSQLAHHKDVGGYAEFRLIKGSDGAEGVLSELCVYVSNVTFKRHWITLRPLSLTDFPFVTCLRPASWEQNIVFKKPTARMPTQQHSLYFSQPKFHFVEFEQASPDRLHGKFFAIQHDKQQVLLGKVDATRHR